MPPVRAVPAGPRLHPLIAALLVGLAACGSPEGNGAGLPAGEPGAPDASVAAPGASLPAMASDGAIASVPPVPPATPATLGEHVEARARALASGPWTPPDTALPPALARLDYSAYQRLRFRPDSAVWRGESPFQLQLFHRGFLFPHRVELHLVDDDGVRGLPFRPSWFDYGDPALSPAGLGEDAGYAGFRVHYPLNAPDRSDEVAVFLGASYFRLLGPGQVHGLSGRGIAVNTVGAGAEEFPRFRSFWIRRPAPGDTSLVFHALLDGPSVAGAYRFELVPGGPETVLEVDALLVARREVARLGVAPLTSMFLYGDNRPGSFDDVRPRVHDSDGLLMHTSGGEWIWRPLSNRRQLQVTSLQDRIPGGFGLVQRERNFDRFLDLEARYHLRPSKWVEVLEGDWGAGGVELVEIPATSEFEDNIVAYWLPSEPLRAGEERRFRYRVRTFGNRLPEEEQGRVLRTVIGWDALPGQADPPPRSRRRFVVDFQPGQGEAPGEPSSTHPATGGSPEALPGSGAPPAGPGVAVEPVLHASSGRISDLRILDLPGGGSRATFRLEPEGEQPSDLLLHLVRGGERITETWSYLWIPER